MSTILISNLFVAALSLIAFGLLCRAVLSVVKARVFLQHAEKTKGIVTGFAQGKDSKGGATYLPIVSFFLAGNRRHQPIGTIGANPPAYRIGNKVTVCYLPKRPHDAKIYSFFDIYSTALLNLIFSTVALVTTVVVYLAAAR